MEKHRTLAYSVAQELSHRDLEQISGGQSNRQIQITFPTLKVTGGPYVPDTVNDIIRG